ncbi:MAG: ATP synthase subunit I [Oscillospiraceae bacterium]|nr:ATP synthase subunit I [Oscillospiraceae bacterium]
MLMKRAVFLNIAAYLCSIIAVGVTLRFASGLLLGTAVLFCTLLLLRLSVLRMEDDAKRYGTTSQRRYLLFYALRLLVFAAAFAAALLFRTRISPVAVVIPMLYPRLIYTAGSLFSGIGKHSREKKR